MPHINGKKGMGKRKNRDKKKIYFAVSESGRRRRISKAEFDRRELLNLPVMVTLAAVGVAATTSALNIITAP